MQDIAVNSKENAAMSFFTLLIIFSQSAILELACLSRFKRTVTDGKYIAYRKKEETMSKKTFSTKYFVEMALLVAIILIMAFTPIGYIKTAGLEIP